MTNVRDKINKVLEDNRGHILNGLIASIVKTETGDPYLNTHNLNLCFKYHVEIYLEITEMLRWSLINYNYDTGEFSKKKVKDETNTSSGN